MEISSSQVDLIETISNEVTDLIEKNIFITSYSPKYYYTKLGELKIEMIDSAGRTIYMEPVANYLEGGGRRVSIEVYPDTAPGTAQLYLVGELKNNYKSIS